MKFLYALFFTIIYSTLVHAQSGEWVWMKGDSLPNLSFYGDFGHEDSLYHPPSLYQASSWTDDSGYFYLFGGLEYDAYNGNYPLYYDGIWRFNSKTNNWKLIKNSSLINSKGVYGIEGVPDINNYPGGRGGSVVWKDHEGFIWIFGGDNYGLGSYNDLWKYNPATNEWAWINGPNGPSTFSEYGVKGVPSSSNVPPPRRSAASWIDDSDNLWLFGGYCLYCFGGECYQDLWKYSTTMNEWTWMGGTQLTNVLGHNGIKGVPDTANLPAARTCNCSWSDDNGNFYLLGGAYLYLDNYLLGDLWKYSPSTQQWTWLQGPESWDSIGTFGTDCIYSINNRPTTRSEQVCLKQKERIWLFGGYVSETPQLLTAANDIWIYNMKLSEWTRIRGDDNYVRGNYGQQGVPSPLNNARCRMGAVGWFDQAGNFWCYGGEPTTHEFAEGDMWEYFPDTTCTVITNESAIVHAANNLDLYPNPATNEINISFPFSNNIITIYDLCGRELKEWKVENGKLKMIDVSFLHEGVYAVEIKDEKGVLIASEKLFKD